jgi:hypothetical protein
MVTSSSLVGLDFSKKWKTGDDQVKNASGRMVGKEKAESCSWPSGSTQ